MFRFLILAVYCCIGLLATKPAIAETEFIQGSRIGFEPPPGFVQSDQFAGFADLQNGASFLVVEMPVEAYAQLASLPKSEWTKRGVAFESEAPVRLAGGEGILLVGRQVAGGIEFKKWALIARFDDFTTLISCQVPMIAATDELSASIEAAFRTVVARPTLTLGQKADALPFQLGSTGNLRVVNVLAGNSVLLTRGPSDTITGAEQPMFVVSRSLGPIPAGMSMDEFSRHTVMNITSLANINIENSADARVAGETWFETVASGEVSETGEPVAIIQWLRPLPDGYLRVVGFGHADDREADFDEYRKVVGGIEPRSQ